MGTLPVLTGINGRRWEISQACAAILREFGDQDYKGCLILAHGAGAPMDSDFLEDMAQRLAAQGVGVIRFEFPYMAQRREGGGKRPPNPQKVLLDCWREVYRQVRLLVAGPLAIGGKSMGGRMASLLADELGPMPWFAWGIRSMRWASRKTPGRASGGIAHAYAHRPGRARCPGEPGGGGGVCVVACDRSCVGWRQRIMT